MKKLLFVVLLVFAAAGVFAQIAGFNQRGKATQEGFQDMAGLYAAHPSLPINSKAYVTNTSNGRQIEVTIYNRIPVSRERIIDLSPDVWEALELDTNNNVIVSNVASVAVQPTPPPPPPKYALVIGNGNYTGNWNSLSNPVNDAVDMEAALRGLGFQVELLRNANLNQMQTAVLNFARKLSSSRNAYGFFYYAGHGAQDRNKQNYLIPADADTPSVNLFAQRTLPVQFVLDELRDAGNELNMIVLDACRNLPKALDRSDSRGLSVIGAVPPGTIVMYATAADSTADDGTGRNGLFTSHLLRNLKTPGLNVSEMFRRTGSDVARATNGEQYPETRYMYFENAYLGARPAITTPAPTPAPVATTPAAPPQRPAPDNMVRINGGTFMMGSPEDEPGRDSNEGPQHQVTISSFYMGKYEVTQKEYQEVMGTNPSYFQYENRPVEKVEWFDAVEYCNKRSQREGLTPAYMISSSGNSITCDWDANGYRLPTEAEWEYACRAGSTTAYNTGARISNNTGWFEDNTTGRWGTQEVGQKPANAWGLYDMHGNVIEWCWDWYGAYPSGAQTDPVGAFSGSNRVRRGGSWGSSAQDLRSAHRSFAGGLTLENRYIGFRVVRNAQ